jgi:mannose-1-phosphate guanylyltransferase
MKAMLLAAGRGTRLAPLTDTTPKILAPFGERPLLVHQLEYLQRGGVSEIALNVHHHAEQVLACLDALRPDVSVRISHERELLGTAGALAPLRDFFTEPTIVLYGDVVTDANLAQLMDEHRQHEPLATLAVYPSHESLGKGVVHIDATGRIDAFLEKPADDASNEVLINAGLYVVAPQLPQLLGPGASDFGHDVWPRVLAAGHTLRASMLDAYVRDIGAPAQLAAAADDLAAGALAW